MIEKKRKELINDIMSVNKTDDDNEETYREFLESLNLEELDNLYDDLILEDLL